MGAGSTGRAGLVLSGAVVRAGQPGTASARSRCDGVGDERGPGCVAGRCSTVRAAGAGQLGRRGRRCRSRSRLGSHRRAGWLGEGEHLRPGGELAGQRDEGAPDPVLVESCRGRLRSPVSLAARMRSSARARRRCRSSRSASWRPGPPGAVLVANAVSRCPSTSVSRSCAPGCGRSLRTITRMPLRPAGQVEQAGDLGDPGARSRARRRRRRPAATPARAAPRARRRWLGQAEPDRVRQPQSVWRTGWTSPS